MKYEAKTGDVFLIPVDIQSWAVGQLVSNWNDELYIAVFGRRLGPKEVDYRIVMEEEPVLLALTFDAKLYHGDWPIIGNERGNLGQIPHPVFKVDVSDDTYLESRDRSVSRIATLEETENVMYRSVSSPAVIEEAVQAYFGLLDWDSEFDEFLASHTYQSSKLL